MFFGKLRFFVEKFKDKLPNFKIKLLKKTKIMIFYNDLVITLNGRIGERKEKHNVSL